MAVAMIVYGGAHWARMESPALGMRVGLRARGALAIVPALVSSYGRPRLAWLVALPAVCVVADRARHRALAVELASRRLSARRGRRPQRRRAQLVHGPHALRRGPLRRGRHAISSWRSSPWPRSWRGRSSAAAWALAAVAVGFLLFALPSTVVDMSAGGIRAALFLCLALAALYVTGERLPAIGSRAAGCPPRRRGRHRGADRRRGARRQQGGLPRMAAVGSARKARQAGERPVRLGPDATSRFTGPRRGPSSWRCNSPIPLYWKAAVLTAFNDDRWTEGGGSIPIANQVGGSYPRPARATCRRTSSPPT